MSTYADCMLRGIVVNQPTMVRQTGFTVRPHVRRIGALVGTACHAGIQNDLSSIMASAERPSERDIGEIAVENFRSNSEGNPVVFDQLTSDINDAHHQICQITACHYNRYAPVSKPVLVEQRLWCQIGNDVVLTGQPDYIVSDMDIIDIKTGAPKNYLLQFAGYGILANTNGYSIRGCEVIGIPRSKRNRRIEPYSQRTSPEVLNHGAIPVAIELIRQIRDAVSTFATAPEQVPCNPTSTLCSDRYCPAWGTKICRLTTNK